MSVQMWNDLNIMLKFWLEVMFMTGLLICICMDVKVRFDFQARSSAWLEHHLDMVGVVGSSPIAPTRLSKGTVSSI